MRHLSATMAAKNTLWMYVALAAAILAAWLVVVLATPTKPAEAAFPGKNGKIAFVSRLDSGREILTMKPNGDNKTILTNNDHVDNFDPAFSPNGKKIAFSSPRGLSSGDIFTMSANGTDIKRVTKSESSDIDPAWSPDGTKIAFSSLRNGNFDIYVINKDGSGLTRITTSPQGDFQPAWSPDGTRIAFRRDNRIYVMKAARESETNRPQRLTTASGNTFFEQYPTWSPNGTRIAFSSNQSSGYQLYSIRADGSDLIRLTNNFRGANDPAWSPDGTKIVFWGKTLVPNVHSKGIYVIKAAPESETNRPKRLTGDRFDSFSPDWQPLR
jgi:Tol biopolymer transport system component